MTVSSGASEFAPIKKTNLSEMLIEYFISNIEKGVFKPGERITNEIDLAEQIKVSRNVLRESMKVLENYGILNTVNGRGTVVAEDAMANIQSMKFFEQLRNDSTVLDILEARLIIEPQIAFFACQRCTDEDIEHLQEVISHRNMSTENLDDYDFHLAVAKICGNATSMEYLHTLLMRLRGGAYGEFTKHVEGMLEQKSLDEHEQILKAFIDKKPKVAAKTMSDHLSDRMKIIKTLYREDVNPEELKITTLYNAMI